MVALLDTTLRDGGYVINFQFTSDDTARISGALDQCSVPYIEVGHGLGLNGSQSQTGGQGATDEEYLLATAASVHQGKWGAFLIPGLAEPRHLDAAADLGMTFVRIGTNATEMEQGFPYIEQAKARGMEVFCNLMKSYVLTPEELGHVAAKAENSGADVVTIVDSAGGMMPEQLEEYMDAIRAYSGVRIGFHGHNNLGLAIANTLRAVECGADVVDTSIRGIGRSAGNAATEILLLVLRRRGIDLGIDPFEIMNIAEDFIDPKVGYSDDDRSLSAVAGFAQFHSSFLPLILDAASRYDVDARRLMVQVCEADRINPTKQLVDTLAEGLSRGEAASGARQAASAESGG